MDDKTKRAYEYFEGVADNLTIKAAELEARLKKGEKTGANRTEHRHHKFYKKLVDEWQALLDKANEYRVLAADSIFGRVEETGEPKEDLVETAEKVFGSKAE